mmetsp:Transcript_97857/g.282348  ORF Transcript_97857/g.282348 Transcript_97857/m.282348 type:complete len:216 (+) Transcript_97857:392-1039(+)
MHGDHDAARLVPPPPNEAHIAQSLSHPSKFCHRQSRRGRRKEPSTLNRVDAPGEVEKGGGGVRGLLRPQLHLDLCQCCGCRRRHPRPGLLADQLQQTQHDDNPRFGEHLRPPHLCEPSDHSFRLTLPTEISCIQQLLQRTRGLTHGKQLLQQRRAVTAGGGGAIDERLRAIGELEMPQPLGRLHQACCASQQVLEEGRAAIAERRGERRDTMECG